MFELANSKSFLALRRQFMKLKFLYQPYHKLAVYKEERKRDRLNRQRNIDLHRYGRAILEDVCRVVAPLDAEIFCDYGTLLGMIREGGLIPHDLDLDMGIIAGPHFSWEELERVLGTVGMKKTRQFSMDGQITEQTYERDHVDMDFFIHVIDRDEMVAYSYFRDPLMDYPRRNVYSVNEYRTCIVHGTQMREINGLHVLIPENSEEFLEDAYGPDWRIPDPNHSYNNEQESALKGKFGVDDLR